MGIYDDILGQCFWAFMVCGGLGALLIGLIAEAIKMAPKGRLRKK